MQTANCGVVENNPGELCTAVEESAANDKNELAAKFHITFNVHVKSLELQLSRVTYKINLFHSVKIKKKKKIVFIFQKIFSKQIYLTNVYLNLRSTDHFYFYRHKIRNSCEKCISNDSTKNTSTKTVIFQSRIPRKSKESVAKFKRCVTYIRNFYPLSIIYVKMKIIYVLCKLNCALTIYLYSYDNKILIYTKNKNTT